MPRSFLLPFVLLMALTIPLSAQQKIPWMTFADWPQDGNFSQYSPEQYIFKDFLKGEWVAYYPEDMSKPEFSRRVELRFGDPAEVRPVILPRVERLADGTYSYTYILQNGPRALLPIESWRMAVAANDDRFQAAHPDWTVAQVGWVPTLGSPGLLGLKWFQWSARGPNQLIPRGGAQGPFTIRSASAPGFTEIWARGKVNRLYDEQIAATLPQPVSDQLAHVITLSSKGKRVWTIGPWFPPEVPLWKVVSNFRYGISLLVGHRLLDADSPFLSSLAAAFDAYGQSGQLPALVDPDRLDFLSQAAPGLESEVAAALQLSLSR